MRLRIASILLPVCLSGFSASAAEIHVIAPAGVAYGLSELAKNYTKETGTLVTFVFGNAGMLPSRLESETFDVVVLPSDLMNGVDGKGLLKTGTHQNLGRVEVGYYVGAGAPHPDISTPEKFRDALKAAELVVYNDPAAGSAGGIVVGNVLKEPEFAGLKTLLVKSGFLGQILTLKGSQTVLEPISEVPPSPAAELVGTIPAAWPAHLDFAVAIPAKTTAAEAGAAFLKYITRPEAAAAWKAAGLNR